MTRLVPVLLWATSALLAFCASPTAETVPSLYDTQQSVERYIASGRYDADFAHVVADASAFLESRAKSVTRPAGDTILV